MTEEAPRPPHATGTLQSLALLDLCGFAGLMSSLHEEFRTKHKDIKLTTIHPYFINTRPDLIKGWHHR